MLRYCKHRDVITSFTIECYQKPLTPVTWVFLFNILSIKFYKTSRNSSLCSFVFNNSVRLIFPIFFPIKHFNFCLVYVQVLAIRAV